LRSDIYLGLRLTSRWSGPHLQCASRGMQGEFGVIVVCSGWSRGRAVRDPGRSPQRMWDYVARGRWALHALCRIEIGWMTRDARIYNLKDRRTNAGSSRLLLRQSNHLPNHLSGLRTAVLLLHISHSSGPRKEVGERGDDLERGLLGFDRSTIHLCSLLRSQHPLVGLWHYCITDCPSPLSVCGETAKEYSRW
jgi:hypothetical protein